MDPILNNIWSASPRFCLLSWLLQFLTERAATLEAKAAHLVVAIVTDLNSDSLECSTKNKRAFEW